MRGEHNSGTPLVSASVARMVQAQDRPVLAPWVGRCHISNVQTSPIMLYHQYFMPGKLDTSRNACPAHVLTRMI